MADDDQLVEKVERADRIDVVFRDVLRHGPGAQREPGVRGAAVRVGATADGARLIHIDVPSAAMSGARCFS